MKKSNTSKKKRLREYEATRRPADGIPNEVPTLGESHGGISTTPHTQFSICTVRSFFKEVGFLSWGGVFRLKHHLKPKIAEIRSFFIEMGWGF